MDEIIETFGLCQIELAILEGTPRKCAGLGRTKIRQSRQRRNDGGYDSPPAMDMQLCDVLARCAGWCRKPKDDCSVDRLTRRVAQQSPRCLTRLRCFSGEAHQ